MPRQSLVSAPASNSDSSLKPPLQKALAGLSVDLETELMRYRQSRKGSVSPPAPRGLAFRRRRKSLDLIQVEGKTEAQTAAPLETAALGTPLPPPLPPNPRLHQTAVSVGSPLARIETPLDAPEPHVVSPEGSLATYEAIPDDFLETTEALLRSTAADEPALPVGDTDYSPSLIRRLTTPLGIGALLLLLVSSAGLGYLLTNPTAIGHLWNHPTLQALRGQSEAAGDLSATGDTPADGVFEPGLEGLGPDLSQREFVDLNRGSLSTLPSGTANAPTIASTPLTLVGPSGSLPAQATNQTTPANDSAAATPAPAAATPAPTVAIRPPVTVPATVRPVQAPRAPAPAAAAPAAPRPAAPAPSPQPQAAPPPLPSPSPQPVAAAPAAATSYYVVTDYTGDQSLSNARDAVGEAYVRNFPVGARIQMGAFEQQSSAQDLVQQLQQQGISAEVYAPD
ncbi:MAG: SPOR domain-containing protein [Cyanobacteria bacterium Co-bin13]|nr:SPOR domain-containing protein [Cyanobacteria bacterium Co-bin13]